MRRFRQASIFLLRFDTVLGLTRVPQRASVMSSTRRTEMPARYISIRASSTELSRRRYTKVDLDPGTQYNSRAGRPPGQNIGNVLVGRQSFSDCLPILCRDQHVEIADR